jgi:hypothetical protein
MWSVANITSELEKLLALAKTSKSTVYGIERENTMAGQIY